MCFQKPLGLVVTHHSIDLKPYLLTTGVV